MIKKLSATTIAKISAGEVILNPSSAVKELIENSIDANSTDIEIVVEEGGKKLIKIKDNGIGMDEKDLLKCFLEHTTSKLRNFKDIETVGSLGFRGEGLFSISSVSNLTITSKSKNANDFSAGYKIEVSNLEKVKTKKIACNVGTIAEVKDIFYNLKPRLKSLESNNRELRKIYKTVLEYALSFEGVNFKLISNKKTLLNTNGLNGKKQRIQNLLDLEKEDICKISSNEYFTGYILKPSKTFPNSNSQYIFINNRPIFSGKISKTIKEAYSNLMDPKSYPGFVIYINANPEELDINVHPTKRKINFLKEKILIKELFEICKLTLEEHNLVFQKQSRYTDFEKQEYSYLSDNVKQNEAWNIEENIVENLDNIIQINNLYLVVKTESSLLMIDQHAAHEKILYEQYKANYENRSYKSRKVNINANVTEMEMQEMEENKDFFEDLGFKWKKGKFLTIPDGVEVNTVNKVIKEYLRELETNVLGQRFIKNKTDKMLKYLACRSAIKGGEYLDKNKRKRLVQKTLQDIKTTYTCPHGRPVLIEIKLHEIEKMFKRR